MASFSQNFSTVSQTNHLEKETIDALDRRTLEIYNPQQRLQVIRWVGSTPFILVGDGGFALVRDPEGELDPIPLMSTDVTLSKVLLGRLMRVLMYFKKDFGSES